MSADKQPRKLYYSRGVISDGISVLYDDLDFLSIPARHRLAEIHNEQNIDWESAAKILEAEGLYSPEKDGER